MVFIVRQSRDQTNVLRLQLLLEKHFSLVQSAESVDLVLVLATDLNFLSRILLILGELRDALLAVEMGY